MPGPKRSRRERTEEWASIKQWTLWPELELYEQIRAKSRPLTRSLRNEVVEELTVE